KPIDLPQAATQWADGVEGAPASLFLTGNIGVGKTHTAWHTARHSTRRRSRVSATRYMSRRPEQAVVHGDGTRHCAWCGDYI
ncbi:ATP-binding protein, partial [Streptomyces sp. A73]|nr:ATP-binding protein [Streptomyces sp. A73]